MTIGVIISTYNNPQWLEKTLWGYMRQSRPADEIIIADDGSNDHTRQMLRQYEHILPIKHVWHEDLGFRKTIILNEALRLAHSEYLVFTDQDCIPRMDFLAVHESYATKQRFLSGGYFKLPLAISKLISRDDIIAQRAFQLKWLRQHGLKLNFKCSKLIQNNVFTHAMNLITPAKATWNGMNSSGWRDDLLAANGFDERMQYGGEDRELGERLENAGIKGRQIRYSAITIHLDHTRPYINQDAIELNKAIRRQTWLQHATQTDFGLNKTDLYDLM